MSQYRVKIAFDLDAIDDVDARQKVRTLMAEVTEKALKPAVVPLDAVKVSCVQAGDRTGRSVMQPGDVGATA